MQYVKVVIVALLAALLPLPANAAEKQAATWNTCKEVRVLQVHCAPRDDARVICAMRNATTTKKLLTATWRLRALSSEEEIISEAEVKTAAFRIQPQSPWGIVEAVYPCGNGAILWRTLVSRMNSAVEVQPYSEQSLRKLGLWSEEIAINLAIFRGVQSIERPSEEVPERIKRATGARKTGKTDNHPKRDNGMPRLKRVSVVGAGFLYAHKK